jgi:hypothetical protein
MRGPLGACAIALLICKSAFAIPGPAIFASVTGCATSWMTSTSELPAHRGLCQIQIGTVPAATIVRLFGSIWSSMSLNLGGVADRRRMYLHGTQFLYRWTISRPHSTKMRESQGRGSLGGGCSVGSIRHPCRVPRRALLHRSIPAESG